MVLPTTWREKVRLLKRETMALYFAIRDPRTPIGTKILAGVVVAYALSPFDLIPDFIPVLGYLDDLILVPIGIAICLRLIPANIMEAARARADSVSTRPKSYAAAAVIVLLWLVASVFFSVWVYRAFFAS
jgi:uncharacterized membrane protein YkvA (DUF1232 family)